MILSPLGDVQGMASLADAASRDAKLSVMHVSPATGDGLVGAAEGHGSGKRGPVSALRLGALALGPLNSTVEVPGLQADLAWRDAETLMSQVALHARDGLHGATELTPGMLWSLEHSLLELVGPSGAEPWKEDFVGSDDLPPVADGPDEVVLDSAAAWREWPTKGSPQGLEEDLEGFPVAHLNDHLDVVAALGPRPGTDASLSLEDTSTERDVVFSGGSFHAPRLSRYSRNVKSQGFSLALLPVQENRSWHS